MIPKPSEAADALSLEFVADLSYNPRTHQYRVELNEPFRSELPRTRNFLLIDVEGFTVEKLLALFDQDVITYYQTKCDQARQVLHRVKQSRGLASADGVNEL